jgi:hypothetical protein
MGITIGIWIRISVGITIEGRITGLICIRMKVGVTTRITVGFTITISITTMNNDIQSHYCWKTGQTDTWTDP